MSLHLIWVWIRFRILPAFFGNPCIYLHSIPIVGLRFELEVWDKTSHAGMGPEISRQLASACVNRFNAVRNLTKSSLQSGRLCGEIIGWDGPLNRGEAKPYWINLNLSIGSTTKTCALALPSPLIYPIPQFRMVGWHRMGWSKAFLRHFWPTERTCSNFQSILSRLAASIQSDRVQHCNLLVWVGEEYSSMQSDLKICQYGDRIVCVTLWFMEL